MILYLVRHGESAGNATGRIQGWRDVPLTPAGEQQAAKTGAFLAAYARSEGVAFAALYSSDLHRAWDTAQAIGRALDLVPVAEPGLREMHFGVVEGLGYQEWQAAYPHLVAPAADRTNAAFGWPGGETRAAFYARVRATIHRLAGAHGPAAHLLLVAHGGVIGSYLSLLAHGDGAYWGEFRIENCSISRVALSPTDEHPLGAAGILQAADARHLAADPELTG